jgi:hypothetical protein
MKAKFVAVALLVVQFVFQVFPSCVMIGIYVEYQRYRRTQPASPKLSFFSEKFDPLRWFENGLIILVLFSIVYGAWKILFTLAVNSHDGSYVRWTKGVIVAGIYVVALLSWDVGFLEGARRYGVDIHRYAQLVIVAGLAALWAFSPRGPFTKTQPIVPKGRLVQVGGDRRGYPTLSWTQRIASDETIASADRKRRFGYLGWVLVAGAVFGIYQEGPKGNWSNVFYAVALFGWLGLHFMRPKASLDPHDPEHAKREENTPVARTEDCEAFVAENDGALFFCIARGDKSTGTLALVEHVPWDSFGNFEEGTHKQWFRSRTSTDSLIDWDVIIVQSSKGRVVEVAQSVGDHASLVELLGQLQITFIEGRAAALRTYKAENDAAFSATPGAASVADVPVQPF